MNFIILFSIIVIIISSLLATINLMFMHHGITLISSSILTMIMIMIRLILILFGFNTLISLSCLFLGNSLETRKYPLISGELHSWGMRNLIHIQFINPIASNVPLKRSTSYYIYTKLVNHTIRRYK